MGDRGNVNIVESATDGGIYLYTHWWGSALPGIVAEALARRERWDDAPYLTRIIFCEMLKRDGEEALTKETGFGISTEEMDPENPTVVVDTGKQTVAIGGVLLPIPFEQFVSIYQSTKEVVDESR